MPGRTVRIGGAAGAWGDSPMGVEQLLTADVQYMMMDYLAEVTMSLLARARLKDPQAGYPADFVAYLRPHLATLAQKKIKVVSNAGGVNPEACKRAFCPPPRGGKLSKIFARSKFFSPKVMLPVSNSTELKPAPKLTSPVGFSSTLMISFCRLGTSVSSAYVSTLEK